MVNPSLRLVPHDDLALIWRLKIVCPLRALALGMVILLLMQAVAQGAPKITITTDNTFISGSVKIILQGFEKNQPVTVSASTTDSVDRTWESYAEFLTDRHGRVDLHVRV